ncbi:MAG: hypothetical protein RLZZ290_1146 [Pseudomonadota bacterium]
MQDLRSAPSIAAKDWLSALNQFEAQGRAYALVTVLRVEPPASARAGDKAVVTPDGDFFGWIGGGCAQPVVRNAIHEALSSGQPVSLRITPNTQDAVPAGMQQVSMACHSGGSVELFIEPHQPALPLHIYGQSPVARILSDLASRVGVPVVTLSSPSLTPLATEVAWAVVATQGQGDVAAIRHALDHQAGLVWFVASARKWSKLQQELTKAGVSPARLAKVIAPAGLPIGAKTPEEIALSVLADVVAARRGHKVIMTPDFEGVLPIADAPSRSCCGGGA